MDEKAEADRVTFGFDAVSQYAASGKGYTTDPVSYAKLTSYHVRQEMWDKWKKKGTPCITFATAGWDTRPRQEPPAVVVLVGESHTRSDTASEAKAAHR